MELPIQIIVVMFVALIVGSGLIYFSQTNIDKSQERLDELTDMGSVTQEDKILEVNSITESSINNLAKQCFEDNKNSIKTEICVVLIGNLQTTCQSIIQKTTLSVNKITCDIKPNSNAVKIIYNAPLNKIEIKS